MNTQLYDIPRPEDLAAIQAWAAVPENRSLVIAVGSAPDVRYQLVVYDKPHDDPSISRAEDHLGAMIQACDWPE